MTSLTELVKEKRADRREAKKNPPCPHDWKFDAVLGLEVCVIPGCTKVADGRGNTWDRKAE